MRQFSTRLRLTASLAFLAASVCLLAAASPATARTLVDMAGRTVNAPDAPKRVYALSPPDALLVYALDPCLLAGWNFPQTAPDGQLAPCTRDLPVLGGFFGQGMTPNKEALLKAAPDLAISGSMAGPHQEFESFFADAGIPVARIVSNSPQSYPAALRFLGGLLGKKERGEALAAYADAAFAAISRGVAGIPADKRVSVYYAEGGDGLFTDGRGSFHPQLIELAGGVNVHPAPQSRRYGMDKVAMETVIGYAPQVILAQDEKCRDMILASPLWKDIPAVRAGRVLLLPDLPFNWFDRPPSFMRILGAKWLANALYPDVFPYDMVRETREFFKLFLGRDLTGAEAAAYFAQKPVGQP